MTDVRPLRDGSDEAGASALPNETRGRVRRVSPQAKIVRERAIIARLRQEAHQYPGLRVVTLAEAIGLSRWQTSVLVLNLVEAGVLEPHEEAVTTARGGRPALLYRLTEEYRARLDAEDAAAAQWRAVAAPVAPPQVIVTRRVLPAAAAVRSGAVS